MLFATPVMDCVISISTHTIGIQTSALVFLQLQRLIRTQLRVLIISDGGLSLGFLRQSLNVSISFLVTYFSTGYRVYLLY